MNSPLFDRMLRSLVAVVRSVFPDIDTLATYPCAVAAQNADGTLELVPDLSTLLPTYSRVKIANPCPGFSFKVSPGARCSLYFENGQRLVPRAALWDNPGLVELLIGPGSPTLGAARVTDPVAATATMATWISAVTAYVNGVAPGTLIAPTGFGLVQSGSATVKVAS